MSEQKNNRFSWVRDLMLGEFKPSKIKSPEVKTPLYNLLVFVLTKQARQALDDGDIEAAQFNASLAQMEALTTVPSISDEQMSDVRQLLVDINDTVRDEIAKVL